VQNVSNPVPVRRDPLRNVSFSVAVVRIAA
jgi:hypothetical protein